MPRRAKPKDNTLLEMAIVGYQREVERISAKIADIKAQLGQRGPGRPKATAGTVAAATGTDQAGPAKRRTISKAGRTRIAAGYYHRSCAVPVRLFLSYARNDDEPFVARLHAALTAAGFSVWFDRVSMPSRQLTFHQEIRDAVTACDRVVLVVGPNAVSSDYVTQEWRFAYFEALKCVNPIVRMDAVDAAGQKIDAYSLIPEDLRLVHAEDFRSDTQFDAHLANLIVQLMRIQERQDENPGPLQLARNAVGSP
jgi:hypothetical protein